MNKKPILHIVKDKEADTYFLANKTGKTTDSLIQKMNDEQMMRVLAPFILELRDRKTKYELLTISEIENCLQRLIKVYKEERKWYERFIGISAINEAIQNLKNWNKSWKK